MPPADTRIELRSLLQRRRRNSSATSRKFAGTSFGIALLCLLAMQLARAWAWRNVLRAAYPEQRIPFLPLAAAYLAGAGINAVVPAHAGDVTKVFLVKRQIPGSSYPAVTSSFLVQTVFDTTVGILVLLYAISQGLLAAAAPDPRPARLRDLLLGRPPEDARDHRRRPAAGDRDRHLHARPPGAALLGPGPPGRWSSSPSRAATCARSSPGRASAGSSASPPSGSSSRPSASTARSAT